MSLVYHNDIDPSSLVDMEGDVKITETKDPRGPNASDFLIAKEDHTIANLLRMKLHTNPHVKFAGYRVPHPTKHDVVLKIQTSSDSTQGAIDTISPSDALRQALGDIFEDVVNFETAFNDALSAFEGNA